ncbi:MAG: leucine-rich repeat domain-containing protein [Bacteroidales bacterium]|nr:leucine-rich repeat domain-containing protein [Bacteroidales bacterium]
MKKIILLSIGIALSVACQQETTPESPVQKSDAEFVASLESFDGPTKTSMTEDNGIVWTKGDQIALFRGATVADTYQVKDQCDGTASGIFDLITDNSGESSSGMENPTNIAVYPFSEGLGCSSATVTEGGITATSYTISGFQFPSVQQYQANSFPQESFAMVAVTSSMSDHNLRFRNVNGALKLQLRGKCVVKSIKLEGNDNEKLAGASSITAYPGTTVPSIKFSSEATGTITLDCGEGVQLDPAVPTIFIISVPPTVFSQGFTVTVVDTEGTEMPVRASVSNEIKRSSILKMPVVTVQVVSAETENIVFEDEVMKELCVKAFDTNGDGELSYTEAAAVTDLSKMTLTKTTFETFNEFQYFTSVKTVPSEYFYNCSSLTSINIPESVTSIGEYTFQNCSSLTNINIPESVTSIGEYTFQNCSGLTSINIPKSVTIVGTGAFRGCSSLKSIIIPESVTSIGEYTFYYCSSLTSISIPKSVTTIGNYAFYGCSSLTSINIPESVTTIGSSTFARCSNLTNISIPESVTKIDRYAFSNCSSLTSISIPESVTTIYNYAFQNCSGLTSINIPERVTIIYDNTFEGCSSLTSIIIPNKVTTIGGSVFYKCSSLKSISIPKSVTSIGSSAFRDCSSLTSISIPESVTKIGNYAFRDCSSLTSTYIKATSLSTYGSNAFYNSPTTIYVPSGSEETYKAGWPDYASRIVGYDYSAAQ